MSQIVWWFYSPFIIIMVFSFMFLIREFISYEVCDLYLYLLGNWFTEEWMVFFRGAVALDGRIEPGDMILQVNDINFENMSNDEAVRVLREVVQKPG